MCSGSEGGKESFCWFVLYILMCVFCAQEVICYWSIGGFSPEESRVTGIEFPYPFIPVKSSAVPSARKTGLEFDHSLLVTRSTFYGAVLKQLFSLPRAPR